MPRAPPPYLARITTDSLSHPAATRSDLPVLRCVLLLPIPFLSLLGTLSVSPSLLSTSARRGRTPTYADFLSVSFWSPPPARGGSAFGTETRSF